MATVANIVYNVLFFLDNSSRCEERMSIESDPRNKELREVVTF